MSRHLNFLIFLNLIYYKIKRIKKITIQKAYSDIRSSNLDSHIPSVAKAKAMPKPTKIKLP